jgi:pimeloyl-ACP methyl ester carboxylesterase
VCPHWFFTSRATRASAPRERELAAGIRNGRFVEFSATDHIPFLEAGDLILAEIEGFLTGSRAMPAFERILTMILFYR